MTEIRRRELLNKTLLVVGLTFIRLPRVFGLDANPWIFLLTLVPFWFVIINNHMPEIKNTIRIPRIIILTGIQILLLFNIAGLLTLIAAIFVKAFIEPASTVYLILAISICYISIFFFLKAVLSMIKEIDFDSATAFLGLSYFLLIIVAIFRTSLQKPYLLLFIYQLITFLIFGLSAKCVLKKNKQQYFKYVFYGIILYLGVNVIFQLIGFSNPTENYLKEYDAVMLSFFGISSSRIYYPLSEGINAFGMVGGAGFVISAAALIDVLKKGSKDMLDWLITCLGIGISFFIIITTDSRGALLFALFTTGITLLLPKIINRSFFGLLMLIQPIVLFLDGNFLRKIKLLEPLSRSNSDILSGRTVIWQNALEPLLEFKWIHLAGYGLYGQEISGIVSTYKDLFVSYANKNAIPLHNFCLQTIYDQGYFGLLTAFLMLFFVGKNLTKQVISNPANREKVQAFSMMVFILLIGSVSVIPSFYTRELFFVFIFIWLSAGSKLQAGDEQYASAD